MSSSPLTSDLRSPTSSSQSEGEVLVRVENVSKIFCRDFKKSLLYGLKDSARDLWSLGRKAETLKTEMLEDGIQGVANSTLSASQHLSVSASSSSASSRALRPGEFWANKDISFELRRGECLLS